MRIWRIWVYSLLVYGIPAHTEKNFGDDSQVSVCCLSGINRLKLHLLLHVCVCVCVVFWTPWGKRSREDDHLQDVDWRHESHAGRRPHPRSLSPREGRGPDSRWILPASRRPYWPADWEATYNPLCTAAGSPQGKGQNLVIKCHTIESLCNIKRKSHCNTYQSETWKSQMYGHNAGWPVSFLYTKYYRT